MKIKVLFTSIGGLVAPNMIKSLKANESDEFYIVGVDMQKDAVGSHFADKFYTVPHGESTEYPKRILEIALKERIDVIVPLSDEEVLGLSKSKALFETQGIIVACTNYQTVKISRNKATMLEFLSARDLPVPKFKVPNNLIELKEDIESLGYPEHPIVFKPQLAHGARGFWLVQKDFDKRKMILGRIRQQISLEWLLESLNDNKSFPKVIVMEYLAGKDFNIDVLAEGGKSIYIIPNERIVPDAGPVQVGLVRGNVKVQEMTKQIVKAFGFDLWVNVEVAYRRGKEDLPLVYEINPHISAPIVANKAAGVDLLSLGIKLALGEKINRYLKIRETKMIRYWNECFIHGKNLT